MSTLIPIAAQARKQWSERWLEYFARNSREVLGIPRGGYRLSPEEKERVAASIQKFQIGEASEGKCLKRKVQEFAAREQDPAYARSIEYFIKEENRHSAYLGNFLRAQGIARLEHTWTDGVFRWLRNLSSLETSLRVLVSAELIALVYYRCLARATGSAELGLICERMCDEERQHVRFQMANLHWMSLRRFPLFSAWAEIAHALVLFFTCLAVWVEHRGVLQTGCDGLSAFVHEVWEEFRGSMDQGFLDAEVAVGRSAMPESAI